MTRPKGTPNKKNVLEVTADTNGIITVRDETGKLIDTTPVEYIEVDVKKVLFAIVDALYDKDGNAATWRPIREKIEAL